MRSITRLSFILAISAICLGAPILHACSCLSLPLKRAFLASDDVFFGTVLDQRGFTQKDPYVERGRVEMRPSFVPAVAIIQVDRRFLGNASQVQEVTLDSCGVLRKGHAYLVFASRSGGALRNHGCLSMPLNRADKEIRRLRRRATFWRLQRQIRGWWLRVL